MHKRFDDLFSALMFAAAVAVVLAGGYCLIHPIARARVGSAPLPVAVDCIALAEPTWEPVVVGDPEPSASPTPDPYDPSIPLSAELQQVLQEACAENDVPMALALGVIQVESCFDPDAVSPEGCYGLMQLNPKYFPDKLSPADNLRIGVKYLGRLLKQYDDTGAALTAYNAGYDTGRRAYANAVLEAAEWWGDQ